MAENEKNTGNIQEELDGITPTTEENENKVDATQAVAEEVNVKAEDVINEMPKSEGEATGNTNKAIAVEAEKLKNETSTALSEAKEAIKKVNLKEGTEETKGFLAKFMKNPIDEMKAVVNAGETFFKLAITLVALWMASILVQHLMSIVGISELASFFRYGFVRNVLGLVKATIAPAVGVVVLAAIILVINKKTKHSLVTIMTTIAIAKIPTIFASVLSILTILGSETYKITTPISGLCRVVSTVLLYFGIKELFAADDDNEFIKQFVVIEAIYFGVGIVFGFLGISLG